MEAFFTANEDFRKHVNYGLYRDSKQPIIFHINVSSIKESGRGVELIYQEANGDHTRFYVKEDLIKDPVYSKLLVENASIRVRGFLSLTNCKEWNISVSNIEALDTPEFADLDSPSKKPNTSYNKSEQGGSFISEDKVQFTGIIEKLD